MVKREKEREQKRKRGSERRERKKLAISLLSDITLIAYAYQLLQVTLFKILYSILSAHVLLKKICFCCKGESRTLELHLKLSSGIITNHQLSALVQHIQHEICRKRVESSSSHPRTHNHLPG